MLNLLKLVTYMLEIEVKIKVESFELLKKKLIDMGAELCGNGYQEDVYYNSPVCDFGITDEALRVRYSGEKAEATYKGPKLPGSSAKARKEINISVSSGQDFEKMLKRLGFRRTSVVSKQRDEYRFNETLIALDNVDDLGKFIEIEVLTEGTIENALEKIEQVKYELEIEGPHIAASYLEQILLKQSGA